MTSSLSIHLTENWRATFVPIGVILAAIVALIGIYVGRARERKLKFEEIHWEKRAAMFEEAALKHSEAARRGSALGTNPTEALLGRYRYGVAEMLIVAGKMKFYCDDQTRDAYTKVINLHDRLIASYGQAIKTGQMIEPSESMPIGDAYQDFTTLAGVDLRRGNIAR